MHIATIAVSVLICMCGSVACARTITVGRDGSGQYTVLQYALDAATAGDTIRVGPGHYLETVDTVRPPTATGDLNCCGHVRVGNLTIIGSGPQDTIIGNTWTASCVGIFVSTQDGTLTVRDLSICGVNCGISALSGVDIERCSFFGDHTSVECHDRGLGSRIVDVVCGDAAHGGAGDMLSVGGGFGSRVRIERCRGAASVWVSGGATVDVSDCDLASVMLLSCGRVTINSCRIQADGICGVALQSLVSCSTSVFEINDCILKGTNAAVQICEPSWGGSVEIANSHLEGGTNSIINAGVSIVHFEVHRCELIRGSGPAVICAADRVCVVHDMTDNYWGTSDGEEIRTSIIDNLVDPRVWAVVRYIPYLGSPIGSVLATERTTWGGVKAMFR